MCEKIKLNVNQNFLTLTNVCDEIPFEVNPVFKKDTNKSNICFIKIMSTLTKRIYILYAVYITCVSNE